jgi:putative Mn2+ efflux pump MntP
MNAVLIAISVTMDSLLLGKQRAFSTLNLMLSASIVHVMAFGFGLLLGETLVGLVGKFDHWVALIVFGLLGLSCLKSAAFAEYHVEPDVESWPKLLLMIFGLSIDAAAVGATSGGLLVKPVATLAAIGLFAPVFVVLGRGVLNALTTNHARLLKLFEGVLFWVVGTTIVLSHTQGGF